MEQKTAWLPAVIALLCLFATASVHAQPYSIYGTVRVSTTGAPLGGVRMNGLPGVPYTNSDGLYAIGVPAGWTGTVTPSFSGYTFSPPSRTYYNVLSMQPDQNYTATPVTNQWSSDPTVNVPVCIQLRDQQDVRIATDAAGNSIVVWLDKRTSGTTRLYAQRVDATGARNWYPPTGGVSVCTMPSCASPAVISDGGEGAIVVWIDTRAGLPKVYAQRLNRNGGVYWPSNGVQVSGNVDQGNPSVASDGAGGAIITWLELASGGPDIKAQRIRSSDGGLLWGMYGKSICTAGGSQIYPVIRGLPDGGAIIAWQDGRAGTSNWDIFAQRVSASGMILWALNGVSVTGATGNQLAPVIDGDGDGAVIAWTDNRNSLNQTIYAQRLDGAGTPQWILDGVSVVNQPHGQDPVIAANGSGGAYIAWTDYRIMGYPMGLQSIWLQQLDASGTSLWPPDGVSPGGSADQWGKRIIRDGTGGVIIAWTELSERPHVYAQRLSSSAEKLWSDRVIVSCAAGGQSDASLASDREGGAVIAWVDTRTYSTSGGDIYAQRVLSNGVRAGLKGHIAGAVSSPVDGLGPLTVSLLNSLGNRIYWVPTVVTDPEGHYLIPNVPPGSYEVAVFEPLGFDVDFNPKPVAVYVDYTTNVDFSLVPTVAENASRIKAYWEHQFSVYVDHVGLAQETEEQLNDYIREVAEHYTHHFRHFSYGWSFEQWLGFLRVPDDPSLFELARSQVAALVLNHASLRVGQYTPVTRDGRTAGDVLTYVSGLLSSSKENEVAHAMVYSQQVNNRVMIRAGAIPEGSILYKSRPDEPAPVAVAPKSFALRGNYPNPFNPSTVITYELPNGADVRLAVYDMLGREVSVLVNERREAGVHTVTFDASGLPSGTYFCRLKAGTFAQTNKMLLIR